MADEFFREQLQHPGRRGRAGSFLYERGLRPDAAAEQFGVGLRPAGLGRAAQAPPRPRASRTRSSSSPGMVSEGSRGIYDRFRGRLVWPIRDIAGDTIGFGARKLYEDDQGPKYLNTPETALYKKSQVLYGIDLAKRDIAKDRQLVVVEGYTDVMACHLAGIPTAVATCGTAFGTDHIKIARRLLSDDGSGGEVIFTFDGDAAGQKAAAARLRGGPAVRRADVRRGRAQRRGPLRAAPGQGRRRRPGPDRHAGARCSSSPSAPR